MKEVIPGFEQGIVGANKGSKRKIKIPSMLAYGEKGAGELIPPNSNLIFEFKILDVLNDLNKASRDMFWSGIKYTKKSMIPI